MATVDFSSFTQATSPSLGQFSVGYDTAVSGGERRTMWSDILTLFIANITPSSIGAVAVTDIGSTVQAYSSVLTTYAGIAPSSNVQTLLGAANYAAFKTSLSLNNVENTALSTWAGSTNLTTLGTIATGTWSATAIAANKGGTGLTSYTIGDLLYASGSSALSALAAVATGQVLVSAGTGTAPAWSASPSLSSVTVSNLTDSALTSGNVVVAGASGILAGTTGLTYASSLLRSSKVTATNPSAIASATIQVVGADTQSSSIQLNSFTGSNQLYAQRAAGTSVSPSALSSSSNILSVIGTGYTGSGYSTAKVYINFDASENWSGSANGTRITFNTTTSGTTTNRTVWTMENDGSFSGSGAISGGAGTFTGVLIAGSGPTTLTDSTGKILSAALNTVAVANGGTGITSFGSGVATWLGTPSSANLAAAITDETGSGALVFATSPTLVTPVLGAATATSVTSSGANQLNAGSTVNLLVPTSSGTSTGPTTNSFNAGYTTAAFDLAYLDSSSTWQKAKADAASTSSGLLALVMQGSITSGNPVSVALPGSMIHNSGWSWTVGGQIYISSATAGALTQTAPTATDSVTRVVGFAVTAVKIFFNPDNLYFTHT